MPLSEFFIRKFESFKNIMYEKYKGNPAKMMVHTGTLGWALSSAAQIWGVINNENFTPDEKKFLLPQEALDAVVNVALFYTITNSCKNLSSKLVSTGKLLSSELRTFIQKNPLKVKLGDFNTNLANEYKENKEFTKIYKPFKNGVDMAVNTAACIIASNIVTPLVRNKIAAGRQKKSIDNEKQLHQANLNTTKIPYNNYNSKFSANYSLKV